MLRTYPATRSDMRRFDAMRAILVHIHFFASFPQRTTLIPAGMTNASHTINAFFTPLSSGIALMTHASPMIMRAVATNSVTRSFHIPSESFFISAGVGDFSPWWIRIQSLPHTGPNHTAPNIHEPTVRTATASQLISGIEKKIENKTLSLYHFLFFYKWVYLTSALIISFTEKIVLFSFSCSDNLTCEDTSHFFSYF